MILHYKKKIIHLKAFTLLETMASIGILALVIIGPLAVLMNSSSYARQTKDTMVATYLAEEAIELLQNQYDSLYVFCKKQSTDLLCTTAGGDTPGQKAWWLFKMRFSASGGQSCFLKHEDGSIDNPSGCSYDFIHMIGDITVSPTRYIATAGECNSIIGVASTTETGVYNTYVCKGVPSHYFGGVSSTKDFTRSVTIEWMPTFETDPSMFNHFNDDLRIVSRVVYRGFNGYPYTITLTQFMHSQP